MSWIARQIDLLPFKAKWILGSIIAFLWFDLFRIRRQLILENISIAFPELSDGERVGLARTSMRHLGTSIIEYFSLPFLTKENWSKRFEIKGEHYLNESLKSGRGVFMMTLHTGNPDLAIAGFSLRGRNFHVISKDFSMGWLNKFWFDLRSKHGTRFISARNSSYAILKALKANDCVLFTMDQFMGPPIGCKVSFFGKETGAAMGLAVLAHRAQVDVLPVIPYRSPDGKMIIELFPKVPFEAKADKDSSIQWMTQVYTNYIEKLVRYKPEQWMWLHRRWKTFKH